jgi:hypothetical protein
VGKKNKVSAPQRKVSWKHIPLGHCAHIASFVDSSASDLRLDFLLDTHAHNDSGIQNQCFPTALTLPELPPTRQAKFVLRQKTATTQSGTVAIFAQMVAPFVRRSPMRLALVSLMCSLPQVRSFSASLPPAEIKGRLMGLRVGNMFQWPWAKWEKKKSILRGHAAAESPPVAREDNRVIEMHGRTRVDPYHWMKDENWQVLLQWS